MITGIRIAIYALLTAGGLSSTMTAILFASLPTTVAATPALAQASASAAVVSGTTPVTMAIAWGGVLLAATFGWKVSRAWSRMENKLDGMEIRMNAVESRCFGGVKSSCQTP